MASSSSSSPEITPADCTDSQPRFSYKDATQQEVLDDLSSRFILNLPEEELALERVCFQVEQAHWFYEDFIREQHTKLPSLPLKKFSEMLFHACPLLQQWSHAHEEIYHNFMQYKTKVPVCGAIMLNDSMDKCVLVKGWKSSSGWGFPKGKINETEPEATCATREVLEETGYNIASQLEPENFIKFIMKDEQQVTLFVVFGVPEDYPFKTKTRKEISKIEWFKLSDLLTSKPKSGDPSASKSHKYAARFYMITPFIVNELKKIIKRRKHVDNLRKSGKQRKGQATTKPQPSFTHPIPIQESGTSSSFTHKDSSPAIPLERQTHSILNPASEIAEPDPHLARLLSSLTLSAVTSSENATHHQTKGEAVASPTIPISDDSEGHHSVAHIPDSLVWSSSVPKNEEQPGGVLQSGNSTATSSSPLPDPPQSSEENVVPVEYNAPRSPRTATPLSGTSPTFSTAQTSQSSRRISSTADISPYLSRAAEIPTSAKRLQQLSLLESVADESARMAPIIAARAAMAGRGPIPNGYPQPPSSVPPHLLTTPRDLGNLYSSYHSGPIPPPNVQPHYSSDAQDPFQVRSRTSQAFHRAPTHNPTGSVSMNQNHLLAAINGSRLGPVSPNFQAGPQFVQQQQQRPPQVYNVGPPLYGSSPHVPYFPPTMNGFPPYPSPLPPLAGAHASSNHNMPFGVNMASHNPTSLTLLSILNGQPCQQPPVPAQAHQ
ncbi:hypothetical protein M413DRAFT_439933 [Hebeloma cylindrosporum]|uniref:Nudix hydrolase domain-containing protein n=1 Tax=Hebeloma cylindrosporum TaxID=76867 RepID=A0A0C2Z4T7_HEBCY|nr:hypothetical protein M413DRAFT_439933 [Hebeloma cylindrosporum h7]